VFGGVPLCPVHASAVKDALAPPAPPEPAPVESGTVVYYITRVDKPGLVKIGTTTQLRTRMMDLAARGRPVTLLGTEPGGRDVERQRHAEFADLRQDGEWFTFAEELHLHIRRIWGFLPVVTYGKAAA
jgi:hypothetical protein